MTDRIHARYWIETAFPLESAAATMAAAGDRLSRTFEQVPGVIRQEREKILTALRED